MARLTEEMVIARTRASDLSNIRKLNCWGSELSDVSLLRRMGNVEVLSLSVNKIGTLADFQFCRNLRELYVRKNNIRDLNQIMYLQDLPLLRNLWLDENPCADNESYRLTVLRALPNLQKLDNVLVQPEEVQDAMRKGRELIHPEDDTSPQPSMEHHWASGSSSPTHSPSQHEEYITRERYYEDYEEMDRIARTPGSGQRTPPRRDHDTGDMRRHSSMIQDDSHYETDRRNANYEEAPMYNLRQHSSYTSPFDVSRSPSSTNNSGSIQLDEVLPSPSESMKDEIGVTNSLSFHKDDEVQRQHYERRDSKTSNSINSRPYPRRPITRSSNILSAVLCLIKELDYPNLEVVEMAVRSRMEEL